MNHPHSVSTTYEVGSLPVTVVNSMFPDENGITWYTATLKIAVAQLATEDLIDDIGKEEWAKLVAPMLLDKLAVEVANAQAELAKTP